MEQKTTEIWHMCKNNIKINLKGIEIEEVNWIQWLSVEYNIKINLKGIGIEEVNWIQWLSVEYNQRLM
jgi:hypothetical protein